MPEDGMEPPATLPLQTFKKVKIKIALHGFSKVIFMVLHYCVKWGLPVCALLDTSGVQSNGSFSW